CKSSAVERNQRAQLRRNHRNHIEDHPFGFVARAAERVHDFESLRVLELLLLRSLFAHLLAKLFGKRFDIHFLKQFLDRFGAHAGREAARIFLYQLAVSLVGKQLALFESRYVAGIDDYIGFEIENLLKLAQRNVEQMPDARRKTFEEPHVRARAGQFDVAETLATHLRLRYFDAALVADHSAMLHSLVLSAQTFPIGDGTEDAGAEETVAFR